MKLLHILKTEPDENTKVLMDLLSEGNESTVYGLYGDEAEYEKLIDLIFEHEKDRDIELSKMRRANKGSGVDVYGLIKKGEWRFLR